MQSCILSKDTFNSKPFVKLSPYKLIDACSKEFLYYCENYHFYLMSAYDRRGACDRLRVTEQRLDEIISHCFEQGYCSFFDDKFRCYVSPQNWAITFFALEEAAI